MEGQTIVTISTSGCILVRLPLSAEETLVIADYVTFQTEVLVAPLAAHLQMCER
jgi:hypothetical protein